MFYRIILNDFANRIKVLIKIENWQRTASDVLAAFDYFAAFEYPEVPDYFKQRIGEELGSIIQIIKNLSPENREEIYKHWGDAGDGLKDLIENFGE